jgi:hypothetical protein
VREVNSKGVVGQSTVPTGPRVGTDRPTTHLRPSTPHTTMGILVRHGWAGGFGQKLCPDARLSQSRRGDDVTNSDGTSPRVSHSHECSRVPRTHPRRSLNVSRVIPARLRTESADHPPFSPPTVSRLSNGSACPCPRSPEYELRPLFPPRSLSSSLPAAGAAWPRHRSYTCILRLEDCVLACNLFVPARLCACCSASSQCTCRPMLRCSPLKTTNLAPRR